MKVVTMSRGNSQRSAASPSSRQLAIAEAREIMPEIEALTAKVYIDPVTGERFRFEIANPAELVSRADVGAPGFGISSHVDGVAHLVLRKDPVP